MSFPFSQFEEIFLGDLPLLRGSRRWAHFSLGVAPTESWAFFNAEYQCAEFIDQSILLLWVVVGQILLQFLEEFLLAILLASRPRQTNAVIALLILKPTVSAYP